MKKVVGIALVALSALTHVRAEPAAFQVTYTGFFDVSTVSFNAELQRVMYFSAEDRDGDGVFSLPEVLKFSFGTITTDSLQSFTYKPGGLPDYWALRDLEDNQYEVVVSGQSYSDSRGTYPWSRTLLWTPDTHGTISAVPEPAMLSMLLAGLAGMVFSLRRR